MLPEHLQDWK